MSGDALSFFQHALVVVAFLAFAFIWARFGRRLAFWGAILLFCFGQYGWAFLVWVIWTWEEDAHRRFMAEERAARSYNGPWID
jgi:hypothetical protein